MSNPTTRPAYGMSPEYNRRLCDVVAALTDEQLAIKPASLERLDREAEP